MGGTDAMMRGILFDLDGVLYNSEEPIDGASEVVNWVQSRGIPHLFVTNTTSRGRAALVEKLGRFGVRTEADRILTPCTAAAGWLRSQKGATAALFVDPRARCEFEGVPCLAEDAEAGADYVVVGDLGDSWDYRTLNRAFRILHSGAETVLVALGMTRYYQAHDGLRLDVAPFIAALELASGKKAAVFGKPSAAFFRSAAERLGLPARGLLMIGDSIETDIAGAQEAGLSGALVRTGKFRLSDLEGCVRPDAVLGSISDLPAWWEKTPS